MPQIQGAISKAQQPVYGDAQKASYLGGLDQLAQGSIESLKQNLARAGALNSGRLSQGVTDINMNRNNQASNFFSQIPFLNRQATMQQLAQMFGAGEGLISQAPRSQATTQTGTNTGSQQQQSNSTSTTSSPWWSGLAQNLIGAGLTAFTGLPFMSGGGGAPAFDASSLPGYGGGGAIGGAATGGGLGAGMPSWLGALQPNNLPFN
jgi:hypothetical protein